MNSNSYKTFTIAVNHDPYAATFADDFLMLDLFALLIP
jgi:hypothetical protein